MNHFARWCATALVVMATAGCSGTPQLNGDQESLGAADALWTAVTSKRSDLLEKSAVRIESLHASGKLPDDAFQSLQAVIVQARDGAWAEARQDLKTFVKGQRPAKDAGS